MELKHAKWFINLAKKSKWWVYWIGFIIVAILYVIACVKYRNDPAFMVFIQTGGILLTLVAMFIIMLQSIYESNKSASSQIGSYQEESLKQIKAISDATNTQIKTFQKLTQQQIEAIQEESEKQVNAYRDESGKQINGIQETTNLHIKALQVATASQLEHLTNQTDKHINAHREESNKQMETVRNANKEQIQSFIEQTEEITSRLEEVSEHLAMLSKLSGEMAKTEKELKEIEEEKLRLREVDLQRQQNELQVSVERIKPVISYRLEERVDIIYWKVYVFLYNAGGDATSVRLNLTYKNSNTGKVKSYMYSHSNLKRGDVTNFTTGRVRHLQGYNLVIIEISTWDVQQREYYANYIWDRKNHTWFMIDAKEKQLLM